jgi:arylformamidase
MASIDYEKEYDNRGRVKEHLQFFAKWANEAAAYREARKGVATIGERYGNGARQTIDFFPAKAGTQGPLALFIHGGYWRALDPSQFSHCAKGANANGIDVAIPGYDLCPNVSIATIIEQMRAACLYAWRKRKQRIMVYGDSAGGHLAACMVATEWKTLASDVPNDLIPAAHAISGIYDMTPLLHVSQNADLRLKDQAEARSVSPLFWHAPAGRSFDAVVGGDESSEFLRQSKTIVEAWRRGMVETRYEEVPGANHFDIVDPLSDANSKMTKRVVELTRKVAAI